jgi:hypothetical protein
MKLAHTSLFLGLSLFSSFAVAGCVADTSADPSNAGDGTEEVAASEDAITAAAANSGYFAVTHRDVRKCASPLCGGFFVKRVNQAKTLCADGTEQAECYVSSITLSGIGLSAREEADFRGALESGKALVKAKTYKKTFNGTTLGTLKASEAWVGATGSTPDGTFYRTADNGLRCIKAPCPSTTAAPLNGVGNDYNVIDVKLGSTATPADAETLDRAHQALATTDGILVAGGVALPKCQPSATSCGPFVSASEFYLRVVRREGKVCGGRGTSSCNLGQYCNWKAQDICGAADAPGACTYKPEICNKIFSPVCACDGKTYGNACEAAAHGASVSSQGACAK